MDQLIEFSWLRSLWSRSRWWGVWRWWECLVLWCWTLSCSKKKEKCIAHIALPVFQMARRSVKSEWWWTPCQNIRVSINARVIVSSDLWLYVRESRVKAGAGLSTESLGMMGTTCPSTGLGHWAGQKTPWLQGGCSLPWVHEGFYASAAAPVTQPHMSRRKLMDGLNFNKYLICQIVCGRQDLDPDAGHVESEENIMLNRKIN